MNKQAGNGAASVIFALGAALTTLLLSGASVRAQSSDTEPEAAARALQGEEDRWFVSGEIGGALLTATADASTRSITGNYGVRGGWRFGQWGVIAGAEQTFWQTTEGARTVIQSAVNLSVGLETRYQGGLLRSSIAAGPSLLAFDNEIDGAGALGFVVDLRPVGVRYPIDKQTKLGFDPLYVVVVAPVLRGIPLVDVQYRTGLYLEFGL